MDWWLLRQLVPPQTTVRCPEIRVRLLFNLLQAPQRSWDPHLWWMWWWGRGLPRCDCSPVSISAHSHPTLFSSTGRAWCSPRLCLVYHQVSHRPLCFPVPLSLKPGDFLVFTEFTWEVPEEQSHWGGPVSYRHLKLQSRCSQCTAICPSINSSIYLYIYILFIYACIHLFIHSCIIYVSELFIHLFIHVSALSVYQSSFYLTSVHLSSFNLLSFINYLLVIYLSIYYVSIIYHLSLIHLSTIYLSFYHLCIICLSIIYHL